MIKAGRTALIAFGAALTFAGTLAGSAHAATYVFLTPDEVAADIHALPAPPADGSDQAKSELAELKQIEADRTSAQMVAATSDDQTKNATIFAVAIGPAFDLKALPATAKLFTDIRSDEKLAADAAKDVFKRNRPWIVDPTILSCFQEDGPQTSFPSGHSTMGYTMAAVLMRLVPEKADAITARADDYAHNRLVCEMHFRSDIMGGKAFGAILAKDMAQSPAFKTEYAAAEAELRAAHVTGP
jgi:acid phosphatase (class A)